MANIRRIKRIFIISLVLAVFVSGFIGFGLGRGFFSGSTGGFVAINKGKPDDVDFSLFWQAYKDLKQNYVGDIDNQKLLYGAIEGAFSSTGDDYTSFLPPDLTKQFQDELSGSLEGIGIQMGILDSYPAVIAPLKDTPAQKAGLRPKDLIIKIDSQDTANMALDEAVSKIRGKEGTQVTLEIVREGESKPLTFKITRAKINVETVDLQIKNSVAILKLNEFGQDSSSEFHAAAVQIKDKGISKVVLDLRSNPGGLLNSAVDIAGELFESGQVVVIEQGKNSRDELKTSGPGTLKDAKLVVLVNGGSASAAEILAGAIQDTGRGKLIGEKTFGKGSVQQIESLPGGSSAKITVAKWLTPKGKSIDKDGITPDIEIKEADNALFSANDPLLNKGLEVLQQ